MTATTTAIDRPNARKTLLALLVSILVHVFIILLAAFIFLYQRTHQPLEREETLEITIIPPPIETIEMAVPPADPTYIATTDAQAAEAPPEIPVFESDKDTRAASELPAESNIPLPSQEGRESEHLEFQDQRGMVGELTPPAPPMPESPAQPAPPVVQTQEQPVEAEPGETEAESSPTPIPPEELAMLEPPVRRADPRPEPTPVPAPQQARQPSRPTTPGYRPETQPTRIQGGISNRRGRAAVDAQATPLGRYKKMLSDAIGSRWYYYVNQQMGLLNVGTVVVRFVVDQEGKVRGVEVLSNTSNESFATCSVRSIIEAEIPPIPPDVAEVLQSGRLEIDYTFTIMGN